MAWLSKRLLMQQICTTDVASITKASTPVSFSIYYSQCSSLSRKPHQNLNLNLFSSSTSFISSRMACIFLVATVNLSLVAIVSLSIFRGGPERCTSTITYCQNLLSRRTKSSAPEWDPKLINFLAQALMMGSKFPNRLVLLEIYRQSSISCCLRIAMSSPFSCVNSLMIMLGFELDWILYLKSQVPPGGILMRKDSASRKVSLNLCSSLNSSTMNLGSACLTFSSSLASSARTGPSICTTSPAAWSPWLSGVASCAREAVRRSANTRIRAGVSMIIKDKYKHIIQYHSVRSKGLLSILCNLPGMKRLC